MEKVITKEFKAIESDKCPGSLYCQINETTNRFLEQSGLYIFKNPIRQNDSQLFFHYSEGASGIIDYNSKTVRIRGLAGVVNNTKNVLEAVSEGIELEEK